MSGYPIYTSNLVGCHAYTTKILLNIYFVNPIRVTFTRGKIVDKNPTQ